MICGGLWWSVVFRLTRICIWFHTVFKKVYASLLFKNNSLCIIYSLGQVKVSYGSLLVPWASINFCYFHTPVITTIIEEGSGSVSILKQIL